MISIDMDAAALARLNSAFKDLAKLSDKPIDQLLRQEGRLTAVEFAKQTAPYGDSPESNKKQIVAIRKAVLRVYSLPIYWVKIVSKRAGRTNGERLAEYLKNRNVAKAQKMLDNLGLNTFRGKSVRVIRFDKGRLHQEALNGKKSNTYHVVTSSKQVETYIKKQIKRSGNLKSGWARAAEMLRSSKGNPTRGIPGWAKGKKRNHDNTGFGSVTGSKDKKVLTITNNYKTTVIENYMFTRKASINRMIKIKVRIKKEIKLELKRLKRKYK